MYLSQNFSANEPIRYGVYLPASQVFTVSHMLLYSNMLKCKISVDLSSARTTTTRKVCPLYSGHLSCTVLHPYEYSVQDSQSVSKRYALERYGAEIVIYSTLRVRTVSTVQFCILYYPTVASDSLVSVVYADS